jgi:hypothetical protein
VVSPLRWGTEAAVRERLRAGVASVAFERRLITFDFPFSPAEVVDAFQLWYGPTVRAGAVGVPGGDRDRGRAVAHPTPDA